MTNLNNTDLLITNKDKFRNLKWVIESAYNLKIGKTYYPSSISLTSRKAVLETDKGIFFLKEKPLYCSDDIYMKRSAYFQEFCSNHIHDVPKIIRTKNGEYYFEFETRKFFLSEYIIGKPFNGSNNNIKQILGLIAELNNAGRDFLNKNKTQTDIIKKYESYEIATLIPILSKYIRTKKDKSILEDIKKTFLKLSEEYNSIGNDDYIMAHSDCILFNFIFKKDQTYLIDFDNAKVLPRIHDLAEFFVSATLLNYLAEITNLKRPVFTRINKDFAEIILDYYKNNLGLSKKEIALFPVIVDIIWIWTLCLSILKEDYLLDDIKIVIKAINEKTNRKEILRLLS